LKRPQPICATLPCVRHDACAPVAMQVAPASQESMHGGSARETWRTWQSDADLDIRKNVINQMCVSWTRKLLESCSVMPARVSAEVLCCRYTLFKNKRPKVAGDWQQKLPEFTRRLEELLYKRARTPVRLCLRTIQRVNTEGSLPPASTKHNSPRRRSTQTRTRSQRG
jgi:hypothetical protein